MTHDENDWDSDFHNKSKYYSNGNTRTISGNSAQKTVPSRQGMVIPRKPVLQSRQVNADFKPDNPDTIQPGMKVEHATFGMGKIIQIEGVSPNRKARYFSRKSARRNSYC